MGLPPINSRRRWQALGLLTATAAVTAIGGPAVAAPATGEIWLAGTPNAVPGSYIVVLKDTATAASAPLGDRARSVGDRARTLARGHSGTVGHVYSAGLTGFEVKLSEAAARRRAADPSVAYVEQNQVASGIGGTQPSPRRGGWTGSTAPGSTATDTARTSPARSAARRTGSPRVSNWSPYGCSSATTPPPRPRPSPGWSG